MVNTPLRKQLRKMALVSLVTVFAAGLPVTILHEYGHGLVCQSEGNRFEFTLNLTGGIGQCFGDVQNVPQFLGAGGALGTSFSLMVALCIRKHHLGIFIGMATLAIGQFANMLLETFAYSLYMGLGGLVAIQMIVLGAWMALITFFVRKQARLTRLTA